MASDITLPTDMPKIVSASYVVLDRVDGTGFERAILAVCDDGSLWLSEGGDDFVRVAHRDPRLL